MRQNLLLVAALLALAPVACGGTADTSVADEADEAIKVGATLTEGDNGGSVTVTEGQSVVLTLSANPTTGYDWVVTSTDKTFGYPKTKFTADSQKVGSGGIDKMTWSTKSPLSMVGTHHVELAYKRSWEKSSLKTFKFDVVVKAPGASAVHIDANDAGKTVSVKKGQDIVVSLASNPTTGYDWSVSRTDKSFGYPDSVAFVADSKAIGSGGTDVLTWKTSDPFAQGTHSVELVYKRAWDKTAAKTFAFTVNVQ
jgi:inhibitor of cysteine peptidase